MVLLGREPGGLVINAGAVAEKGLGRRRSRGRGCSWNGSGGWGGGSGGSGDLGGGWGGSGLVQSDGEGVVELPGQEDKSCYIQEAIDSSDEGPTNNGVHGNIFSQCNVDAERAVIGVEVGHMVGDHSAEEASLDGLGDLRGVGLDDSSSEADGVKELSGIIKLNEAGNAVRVFGNKNSVVGVQATVEAGTSVEKRAQGGCCGGKGVLSKGQVDGGKDM